MKKLLFNLLAASIVMSLLLSCASIFNPESDPTAVVKIIPEPAQMMMNQGSFTFDEKTGLSASNELQQLAKFIKNEMKANTGLQLNGKQNQIVLSINSEASDSKEGYILNVMPNIITIQAPTAAGVFYGYQSLKQLMPEAVYQKGSQLDSFDIPCLVINDAPRFEWRGLMLDSARHFQSVSDVKQFIDLLAMHKMNTLHWHLTEDQGWRIEIKKYPELTQKGSIRQQTLKGHYNDRPMQYDGTPYGGFYTQEEAKEIVAYAAERFVTVVPEIELPGHAQAAVSVYPQFGNTGNKNLGLREMWGVSEEVYNVNDETIAFLKDIFDEIFAIFPSKYIHVGGDECPKVQWKASADAQARIAKEGLKDEFELQSWFIDNFANYFEEKGRHLIGWDEILEGGLPKGASVMSWRGEKGGIKAAKMGHKVVMTPTTYVYLDYYQDLNKKDEPLSIGGNLPLSTIYKFDPCPALMPKQFHSYVLGGQGNVWTEYMKDIEQVLYMAWPRAAAISECVWSAPEKKNFGKFTYKLENAHYLRLANNGTPFRYPDNNKSVVPYSKPANADYFEINLPPSTTGYYQIFVKSASANAKISKAELLVNDEVVDTHKREGNIEWFVQGTVYNLSANPMLVSRNITKARIYMNAENDVAISGEVVIKTLEN